MNKKPLTGLFNMAFVRKQPDPPICPFIDMNDPQCARHFTLGRMDEAFDLCLTRHRQCVTYYRILQERQGHVVAANIHPVAVTINGVPTAHGKNISSERPEAAAG